MVWWIVSYARQPEPPEEGITQLLFVSPSSVGFPLPSSRHPSVAQLTLNVVFTSTEAEHGSQGEDPQNQSSAALHPGL